MTHACGQHGTSQGVRYSRIKLLRLKLLLTYLPLQCQTVTLEIDDLAI